MEAFWNFIDVWLVEFVASCVVLGLSKAKCGLSTFDLDNNNFLLLLQEPQETLA